MRAQLPRRADPIFKHIAVLVFVAGLLALIMELTADHRALGTPPLSAVTAAP